MMENLAHFKNDKKNVEMLSVMMMKTHIPYNQSDSLLSPSFTCAERLSPVRLCPIANIYAEKTHGICRN